MKKPFLFLTFSTLLITFLVRFRADAAPAGPVIKHFSSLLKWTKSASKSTHSDGNVIQFESGYLVETVVEGNALGVVPYSIRVSQDGELFAVDCDNSNIVRITPPLSQYSRARLVAGSFQGKIGHVDGKPSDARFNHPKGVTIDDKGNVYVADTENFAIRKIGEAGVTTIAGGKSNIAGYRDGPSEDAKFSSDFDVVYVRPTCSLLVVDRGNAALRRVSLNQEDCDYSYSSISGTDIFMVIGAILVGFATCMLQQGLGPSLFSRMPQPSASDFPEPNNMKQTPIVESMEEPVARWPSLGQLIIDLSKLALEAMGSAFLFLIPSRFRHLSSRKGLTPMKDSLRLPEDEAELQSAKHSEMKVSNVKTSYLKDPSPPSVKHRSSKRHEFAQIYGSSEILSHGNQARPKSQKERTKHRHRDRSGEVGLGALGQEPKPVDVKAMNYEDPRFDPYNFRSKYGSDDSYRF
ncbi:hypothetical protein Nepgr_027418 [Nepenthes gracilis]|uniref:NHL repeat-containing protein n=1 Tax=Nepenthes gracilis TaxID=150966 RepID=A0AAD3Y2Y0_NEPGR|nr:hypothetical protein Nepgr_027418 [Nepenthes gracilis]